MKIRSNAPLIAWLADSSSRTAENTLILRAFVCLNRGKAWRFVRNRHERAKDILYIHNTIDTFATRTDDLSAEWLRNIRHELHANSVRAVESAAATFFGAVTDSIRAASRIVQARNLTPEAIRETCNVGFTRIFQPRRQQN